MALLFPSQAWLDALVELANRHPDLPQALEGLGRDLAAVIERDLPAWPTTLAAHGRQAGGRFAGVRVLDDEDELLELAPAYVLRAPYRIWKGLVQGDDPVQAALSGRVRVQGDLQSLVRRAHFRHIVDDVLRRLDTAFVDGPSGPRTAAPMSFRRRR